MGQLFQLWDSLSSSVPHTLMENQQMFWGLLWDFLVAALTSETGQGKAQQILSTAKGICIFSSLLSSEMLIVSCKMDSLSFYEISLHSIKAPSLSGYLGFSRSPKIHPPIKCPYRSLSGCVQGYRYLIWETTVISRL